MSQRTASSISTRPSPEFVTADHLEIVVRLAREERLDNQTSRRWFEETVRFLDLAAESSTPAVPSKAIDAAWHVFLLHTRRYAEFCEARYGRFVHHDPAPVGEERGDPTGYLETRAEAETRYGALDPMIWPDDPAVTECKGEGNCKADCDGSCSGSE